MKKKPEKKKSGSEALKASGRKALTLAVTPEQREIIRVAAAKSGMASGPWVLKMALEAAENIE